MPTTSKNRDYRLQLIHKCLKNSAVKWSVKKLHQLVSDRLEKDFGETISPRAINDDLKYLELHKMAPIASRTDGREVFYYYEDDDFELHAPVVDADQYLSLALAEEVLRQLKGFPLVDDLEKLVEKLEHQIDQNNKAEKVMIRFEEQPDLRNIELMQDLFECIREETVVQIEYKSFQAEVAIQKAVHPYLLKQYNRRWFLFGYDEGKDRIDCSPIDRILAFKPVRKNFIRVDFDADAYFKDIIGVTRYAGKAVEKLVLQIAQDRADYMLTKPLHPSQRSLGTTDEGHLLVELSLAVNRELIATLLSFGKDVVVLEPETLRNEIRQNLQNAVQNY